METGRAKHAEDFEFGSVLGEGTFGAVVRCIDKETGTPYACKILEKRQIIRQNKQKYVITERDILFQCNHPNIVKLFYTFRSETKDYVLELCSNGELLTFFKKYKSFSEEVTRFYVAELINALEHLHSQGIVHRDIKLNNLLLSEDMHLKLTDFGTAKNLKRGSDKSKEEEIPGKERSSSFVGTAEYVAPEILNSEPVTTSTDLWSVGVVVYQLLSGEFPFKGKSDMLTFELIKARDLHFPKDFPPHAVDLVDRLLQLNPAERLGADGFAALRAHPFFAGIQFDGLWDQKPPCMVPNAAHLQNVEESTPVSSGEDVSQSFSKLTPPEKQAEFTKKWSPYIGEGETVLHCGLVFKRKGLSVKKRYLLLTAIPRLIYISPKTNMIKGEVPWASSLTFESKGRSYFYVDTGRRRYNFECTEKNAVYWVRLLEAAMKEYREKRTSS